jgi:serine/threonine protein kinase
MHTTVFRRGTSSYRAPEILSQTTPQFNKKSDIFAFGCIIFEIITLGRLFSEDYTTHKYASTSELGQSPRLQWFDSIIPGFEDRFQHLEKLVASMLEIDRSVTETERRRQFASHKCGPNLVSKVVGSGRWIKAVYPGQWPLENSD